MKIAEELGTLSKLTTFLGTLDWKRHRGENGLATETTSPLESPDARMMEHDGH